jgi:hypothetical protein
MSAVRKKTETLCSVCRLETAELLLCKGCQRSYDRSLASKGEGIDELIKWVARRAWKFAVVSAEAQRAADVMEKEITRVAEARRAVEDSARAERDRRREFKAGAKG